MWDSWMASSNKNQLTVLFCKLSKAPPKITDIDFQLKKNKDDQKSAVNDLKKLPPSEGPLLMHSKRATLQAGYLWKESDTDVDIPNPELRSWSRSTANSFLHP